MFGIVLPGDEPDFLTSTENPFQIAGNKKDLLNKTY